MESIEDFSLYHNNSDSQPLLETPSDIDRVSAVQAHIFRTVRFQMLVTLSR